MSQRNGKNTNTDVEGSQVLTIDGTTYHLRRTTTGEDYLFVQDRAQVADAEGKLSFNRRHYELSNLITRLRTPNNASFTEEQLLQLPRKHFQIVSLTALRLDALESEDTSDFLAELSPEAASPPTSETSSDSPVATSEPSLEPATKR